MSPSDIADGIPDALWRRVRDACERVLMLDFDGTLAPLRPRPEDAAVPPEVRALLDRIHDDGHTRLAIVSGRPAAELAERLSGLRVPIFGAHGAEWTLPDGTAARVPLASEVVRALALAAERADEWAGAAHVERKHGALVVHARHLAGPERDALLDSCTRAWAPLAQHGALRFDRGAASAELRASAVHKGVAVRALRERAPAGALGVFVGDDLTDEDAFEAVRDWGFGVRVGPRGKPTYAQARLPECEAVPGFLARWLAATGD